MGKLGGITHVFMIMFGWMLYPISEHSFVLKTAKKLFLARTRDPNLLKDDPKVDITVKGYSKKVQEEL